jgi:YD repeat-containing protein
MWNTIGRDRLNGALLSTRRSGGPGGGPSPVGGVYLGGSGQSLEGVGLLDGITQDANGNLVLVGKTGGEIKLPPLRLDDVVTVFRSVYLNGEGPTVTIDPDEKNPKGPTMLIRHSAATEATYVGWVLYQADRLMKGYSLGQDNVTKEDVTSAVPGYAKVLDTLFFGGGQTGRTGKDGLWERFWIVPAAAHRFAAAPDALTLLDVPLKLRTQPMKWSKGKLVDDTKRAPSKGAASFSDWFTTHYGGIAAERYLLPPPETGITVPVPVFTELQRIALLTAIAERLRDQGVPLPFWMRDYQVRAVPFDQTTPSLEVSRSEGNREVRVFGGVSLSPPTADVKLFTQASGVATLPAPERTAANARLDQSAKLSQAVRTQVTTPQPLTVQPLTGQGSGYQAVALPGADTQALAPAILDETDLRIPIGGGEEIRLARRFNSFFDPSGPWGQGWALDLPRLDQVKIPEQRAAQGTVTFLLGHELVTPLNSTYARFARAAPVPELNGSRLLVPDRPGEFFGLGDARPDFLTVPTRVVIRKDGERWHFGEGGALVATERNGYRTVYERDANGRIKRILGLQGKQLAATIALAYDPASGRLQSATSQRETGQTPRAGDQATVHYAYDADGRLSGVTGDEGRTGYRYAGSRVAAVTNQAPSSPKVQAPTEVTVRTFEYNPRGQLLAETDAVGTRTDYRVTTDTAGQSLAVVPGGAKETAESVRYDPAFRPLEARFADGTQATWSYPVDGGASVDLKQPDGATIRLTETADRTRRTLALDGRPPLIGQYDSAGRLTSLNDGNRLLLRQEWRPDGRLGLAADERSAVRANYDQDGLLTRLLQTPPQEQNLPQPKQWQATELDPAGRPRKIADYRGLEVAIDYDAAGDLAGIGTKRDGGQYGYQLIRDAAGRVAELKSSWGNQRYDYDGEGRLVRVDMDDSGVTASAEWKDGQLAKVRQFDGGQLSVAYYPDGPLAGLPKQVVTPNALALKYQYDAANRLASVDVGSESRLKLGYDAKGRLASWAYAPAGR